VPVDHAAATQAPSVDAFVLLDGRAVPAAWRATLAKTLLRLLTQCQPVDLAILRSFQAYGQRFGSDLRILSANAGNHRLKRVEGITGDHPVASMLLALDRSIQPPPSLDLLAAILCNAALDRDLRLSGSSLAARLAEIVRGALKDETSVLRVLLAADAHSIPDLLSRMDQHLESGSRLHESFERLWDRQLRGALHRWMRSDPVRLGRALAPTTLVPDLAAPEVPLYADVEADNDDTIDVAIVTTEPLDPGDLDRSPGTEFRRAKAAALVRASEGDLLVPSDFRAPEEICAGVARGAIQAAAQALQGPSGSAEPYVALAFVLATGVRAIDLDQVRWGGNGTAPLEVCINRPILRRAVMRPPNAVNPGPGLSAWLEPSSDRLTWPLPPSLHALLTGLAGTGTPEAGSSVFPAWASAMTAPYRLRNIVAQLRPGTALGASAFRQAMAARLAHQLGAEVVQLALGDTFSMSSAAAYYSAPRRADIAAAVCDLQTAWFGESFIPAAADQHGCVGSRLVLTEGAARRWPHALRSRRQSIAHSKDVTALDAWVAHRDFLAGALCAVTGHRPVDAIGQLDLDQIIPEYGLVILNDKQVDPLRKHRVAATGQRWLTELRAFLDRLVVLSDDNETPQAARLAAAILRSEAPLFSVPGADGAVLPLDAAGLRASMPDPLPSVANHYRHRLNQYLQYRGVDPELRHAQLGWVLSPTHALADLSPISPREFGRRIGPVLDDLLLHDGWFPPSQRLPAWAWDGVPARPPKDWVAEAAKHDEQHRLDLNRVRQDLRERGRQAERDVLPRLARAILEFLPEFRLNVDEKRLERARPTGRSEPVDIDEALCGLICDRVRQSDERPIAALEAVATRILLHRLIRRSHRDGLTRGFVPRRPVLSMAAVPSPFLPGLGLAVRHAHEIRRGLLQRAKALRAHDEGVVATLSIVAFSACRDIALARAAVHAAPKAQRGRAPGDWLRVPAIVDRREHPLVMSGLPALLLARRGKVSPTARAPQPQQIEGWLRDSVRLPFDWPEADATIDRFVDTMRAAGRIELAGPERLLMLGPTALAAARVERCLAHDDQWPACTSRSALTAAEDYASPYEPAHPERASIRPASSVLEHYGDLTELLNSEQLPAIVGKSSDDHRGWRTRLAKELERLRRTVGETTPLGLITGFVQHRLRYGGQRRRELQHRTLQTEVTRFARGLLQVVGARDLLTMPGDELRDAYLAVLEGKPRFARAATLEALRMFQRYLEDAHQVQDVSFDELAAYAGPRVASAQAGLVTDAEVGAIGSALTADLAREQEQPDASPEFVRLAELRLLMFTLLEGSGARPGSIYGLVLGDLHLYGPGRDYLHLHRSGGYGEAKSRSSIGFVPLEGEQWVGRRDWVVAWVARELRLVGGDAAAKTPLFAHQVGSGRRFNRRHLTSRLGDLLRWATDDREARVYWLRKRRIMARWRTAMAEREGHARDGRRALCASGHAGIETPLSNYICDPAIAYAPSLREGRFASRAALLDLTGIAPSHLDMAWQRAGGPHDDRRLTVVFERLGIDSCPPPQERLTTPPPLRRQLRLLPRHIDAFARALRKHGGADKALLLSGLSQQQASRLQAAATRLLAQRGRVPWHVPGLRQPRAIMQPPRRLAGTQRLFALLDEPPSPAFQQLAAAWATRSYVGRLAEDASLLVLASEQSNAVTALRELGLTADVTSESTDGVFSSLRLRDPAGRSSFEPALAWVLAMLWLHTQVVES
jgi:hypothetical protein